MQSDGNREIFSRNLRALMESRGRDRGQVCADLGLKYTTFTDWYKGVKYPRIDKIEQLARYFGVSKSALIEESDDEPASGTRVPVLGDVAAGPPILAQENIIDYEEIDPRLARTGEFFALRIRGASMEPRMREGDVVIVRRQRDADNGCTAVVKVGGEEATVKRIKKEPGGGIWLLPNNPDYDPMHFTAEETRDLPVEIIGRVVELRGKF